MTQMIKLVFGPVLFRAGSAIILLLLACSARANDIERVLYSFPADGSTGANPNSGVVAWQGDIYGTTSSGGQSRVGVLFRLHHGRERVLHSFGGHGDFGGPYGQLVLDEAGTIYGATSGSVYKLTAAGVYTTLHAFTGEVMVPV